MIGAAIGAIGGLASGLLGAAGNASLNSATRNWQTSMYYIDRDYNTPANQMKRLREAGINPHIAMANGMLSSGQTSGAPSAPSTHPYDFSPIAQGMSQAGALYQQSQLQKAQVEQINAQSENQRIKNDFEAWNQYTQILDRLSGVNKNSVEAKLLRKRLDELEIDLQTRSEENRARIDSMRSERQLNEVKAKYEQAQLDYQEILNGFAPEQQKIITDNLSKQGREIESAIGKNNSDAALAAANKALSEAQKEGVKFDKLTKERMADYLVDQEYWKAQTEKYRSGSEAKRYYGGRAGYELPVSGYTDKDDYNKRIGLQPRSRHK